MADLNDHNYVVDYDYIGNNGEYGWCGTGTPPIDCQGVVWNQYAMGATRTQLTFELGPEVTVENAGDVEFRLGVSGWNGTNIVMAEDNTPYVTGADIEFVVEIGKGNPSLNESANVENTIRSDDTCLFITGSDFEITSSDLIVNERLGAQSDECSNFTDEDLRVMTFNCTSNCDKAYWQHRNFRIPQNSETDTELMKCGMWPDLSELYNSSRVTGELFDVNVDLLDVEFACSANGGTNPPEARVLYSTSNTACLYMDALAAQNEGVLRATIVRKRYTYVIIVLFSLARSYTFARTHLHTPTSSDTILTRTVRIKYKQTEILENSGQNPTARVQVI